MVRFVETKTKTDMEILFIIIVGFAVFARVYTTHAGLYKQSKKNHDELNKEILHLKNEMYALKRMLLENNKSKAN